MRLQELFEGKVKDLAYNQEYDRQHDTTYTPPARRSVPQYYVAINGKKWKDFETEKAARAAANTVYNRNPRLRVDVIPIK